MELDEGSSEDDELHGAFDLWGFVSMLWVFFLYYYVHISRNLVGLSFGCITVYTSSTTLCPHFGTCPSYIFEACFDVLFNDNANSLLVCLRHSL